MTKGHWQRIENLVDVGTPDVNGCLNGEEIWIELKIDLPGNKLVKDLLRPSQKIWFFKRIVQGAKNLFVLVKTKRTLKIVQMISAPSLFNTMKILNLPLKVDLIKEIEELCR